MESFDGKTAIVTGAGGGIGRETVLKFAREGAKVLAVDVDEESGQETVDAVGKEGGTAEFFRADVSDEEDAEAMVNYAVDQFGGLHFAHNNAGIEGPNAPAADETIMDWDNIIDVNLKGVFLGMKFQIPEMLKQKQAAIVNTASIAGVIGYASQPAYTASKHGVVGLTKAAALSYSEKGIRINSICPGVIDTQMVRRSEGEDNLDELAAMEPIGRLGQPEEIANAVVWLCSGEASFVTGHAMRVDGGYTAQ